MHLRRLFGTDGIRGVAGEYPLDKKTVYAIGRALGDHLPDGPKRVVIGQDTRESSIWIASVLAAGGYDFHGKMEKAGGVSPPTPYLSAHPHRAFFRGVDCANGAASAIAPEIFNRSGAHAEYTHTTPNGRNINENCGALHPEIVGQEVVSRKADLGICFDGDADRALFTDSSGNVVNGDAVMLLLAREMKQRGTLANNTVVATTMSNMGLAIALREFNIKLLRAPVGDKYVLDEMKKSGAVLGGEQSGHIILSREATTGDGMFTAMRVLAILAASTRPIAQLVSGLKVFPQTIKNIRVREKRP